MPTIDTNLADLHHLIGRPLTIEELDEALAFAKAEVDSNDPKTGTLRIKFEDTNQPYLWSAEGVAILLRGILGIETGLPKIQSKPTKDEVIVDPSVKAVRPFIAVFSAKGKGVSDDFLRQLIQFQEKFCEAYGMKRAKVSIGIYSHDKVKFPVTFKAVEPKSLSFVPLGFEEKMSCDQILSKHPTGQAYAKLLAGFKKYPVLIDSNNKVLSLIPIINSADLGKIEVGDKDLMFECTGTDEQSVELCSNIFAHALAMRGFEINCATTKDGEKKTVYPTLKNEDFPLDLAYANKTLGTDFSEKDAKSLLEKCRSGVKKGKGLIVTIPSYRKDILHPIDLVEDIAIMADYNDLPTFPLESYTVGDATPSQRTIDIVRDLLAGQGMQEVLSPVLCNKELLYDKMSCDDLGTVELSEFMSASFSCVRSWLLPLMMDVLSKNLHREYPQNIFETGETLRRKGEHALDIESCAGILCSPDTDYTKVRQAIDTILHAIGLAPAVYEPLQKSDPLFGQMTKTFIPGRSSICRVKGKAIAVLGEINPEVLDRFEVRMPVSGFELNLSELHELRGL